MNHAAPNRLASDAIGHEVAPATNINFLVAVVDDEINQLTILRRLLERWGYSVIAAESTKEVLTELRSLGRQPDAIISDYRLSNGLTGIGAIQAIRGAFALNIPAIVITGETRSDRLREIAENSLPVLFKPANFQILHEWLRHNGGKE